MAHLRFRNHELPDGDQVVEVVFRGDVASVLVLAVCVGLVEVHLFLCASTMSVYCMLCHFGYEVRHLFYFNDPTPSVFLSQPSPFYAQEGQHPTSSLLRLLHKVCWSDIVFPQLWPTKTLLLPFWPYQRQGTGQNVLAVPDPLALP